MLAFIVRSGGEPHLSAGFLLWRIANAQLAFIDEFWPAVTPEVARREVRAYRSTERRLGK